MQPQLGGISEGQPGFLFTRGLQPAMSSRDARDDDLEDRLDELADVLNDLRRDLRETERDQRSPRGPLRPPRLSELIRFTEQYTIPTIIALLETTIKSLELLQGTLRLADPGRNVTEGSESTGDRLADVREGATAGLSRSLTELRTALSEGNLPEDAASRSIIADARDLTAEIESRIDESRRDAGAARSQRGENDRGDTRNRPVHADDNAGTEASADADGAVQIDVTDPDAVGDDNDVDSHDAETDHDVGTEPPSDPEVNVESELKSIKQQVDEGESNSESGDGETGDSHTAGDTHDAGDTDSAEDGHGDERADERDTGTGAN